MKKAILMSVPPEWVAKILNGEKTMEIRKNMPKCDTPIDVYIYCTKNGHFLQEEMESVDYTGWYDYPTGVYATFSKEEKVRHGKPLNGKIVAKFQFFSAPLTLEFDISEYPQWIRDEMKKSCMTEDQFRKYRNGKRVRCWKISDLEILDKPKELSEFFSLPKTYHHDHESMVDQYERKEVRRLKRAPRSWQYIEVKE